MADIAFLDEGELPDTTEVRAKLYLKPPARYDPDVA